MNQLWVRLSLAFAVVVSLSFILMAVFVRLNYAVPDDPPPPEVIAYFQEIGYQRFTPDPLIAFAVIGGLAIIAGALVSRWVASPMSDLEEAANDIGQGELSARVEPRGSQEMVAVGAAFNDMAVRLEQVESVRQSLLSDVAHELRHPLHVLQGNLQAMQDGVYPVNDEEIERLMTQTRHLTVMVNDLHVLAQAEAHQLPLHVQQVDIAGLVKDVASDYQPLAQAHEIGMHVELLGTMPPAITVDKARIRQAVQNLIDNALRHTPDGGRVAVTVEAPMADGNLQIQVSDNGDGIAPDQLPLVFDRLYRGDLSRQRGGGSTGLGLAISKALVDAHGGTITADSPGENLGSTFTIELPV